MHSFSLPCFVCAMCFTADVYVIPVKLGGEGGGGREGLQGEREREREIEAEREGGRGRRRQRDRRTNRPIYKRTERVQTNGNEQKDRLM